MHLRMHQKSWMFFCKLRWSNPRKTHLRTAKRRQIQSIGQVCPQLWFSPLQSKGRGGRVIIIATFIFLREISYRYVDYFQLVFAKAVNLLLILLHSSASKQITTVEIVSTRTHFKLINIWQLTSVEVQKGNFGNKDSEKKQHHVFQSARVSTILMKL